MRLFLTQTIILVSPFFGSCMSLLQNARAAARFAYDGPGQLVQLLGAPLGWPEPIYKHVGYGFELGFPAGTI